MSKKRKPTIQFDSRFLDAMAPDDKNVQLRLTKGAMEALHNCQEEFIAQLVEYLEQDRASGYSQDAQVVEENGSDVAAAGDNTASEQKQTFVKPEHIERAMGEMGFLELFREAQTHQQVQDDKNKASSNKRKKPPKGKKFSAEMEAEQERLLQLSKQNAMHPP